MTAMKSRKGGTLQGGKSDKKKKSIAMEKGANEERKQEGASRTKRSKSNGSI